MEDRTVQVVRNPIVAVIGASDATVDQKRVARRVGRYLAEAGITLVTGGGSGVMEAACQGAARYGGLTLGILPGASAEESPPNPFVQIPLFTGMGHARNAVLIRCAGSVVAVGGGYGTLSEIGLALACGRPVILLGSWEVHPPIPIDGMDDLLRTVSSPQEAANLAVALAGARFEGPGASWVESEEEDGHTAHP